MSYFGRDFGYTFPWLLVHDSDSGEDALLSYDDAKHFQSEQLPKENVDVLAVARVGRLLGNGYGFLLTPHYLQSHVNQARQMS